MYLAWGERQFGVSPVPPRLHDGWVCVVVEHGTPTLVRKNHRQLLRAPVLALIGPDCVFGWEDQQNRSSRLLMWMWRRSSAGPLRHLPNDVFVSIDLHSGELSEFRELHRLTRREIHRTDPFSVDANAAVQVLLETRIGRLELRGAAQPDERVDEALRWMREHLATRQPLARVADYLGLSAATVRRLFRSHLGATVTGTIRDMRRREAERLLRIGTMSVKEVAYRLGYRFPHDFSRAFRRATGSPPSAPKKAQL